MQSEKIAVIALIVIIAGALSAYLLATYGADIFSPQPTSLTDTVEIGDCININYTGRYASNNTIFDSSYEDPDAKTGGTPLEIFVTLDPDQIPPIGYSTYSSSIINGLMTRLIGLKEGESYTLGPIPPKEAYGQKFDLDDTVNTTSFNQNIFKYELSLNQTMEVIKSTPEYLVMKWTNPPEGMFTMTSLVIYASLDLEDPDPDYNDIMILCPLYSLWENATQVIDVLDESVVIETTPTKLDNIAENVEQIPLDLLGMDYLFIFPDATTAAYTNDTITITSDPVEGKVYTYSTPNPFGGVITYELTIESVTAEKINISQYAVDYNETMSYEINRTISFSRTLEIPRLYNMTQIFLQQALPQFQYDLDREGYGISNLSGESLIFEVNIENIFKTSQEES
jgi:FKBP-type peptidyl-prolyl cis-trans isomerase 2